MSFNYKFGRCLARAKMSRMRPIRHFSTNKPTNGKTSAESLLAGLFGKTVKPFTPPAKPRHSAAMPSGSRNHAVGESIIKGELIPDTSFIKCMIIVFLASIHTL